MVNKKVSKFVEELDTIGQDSEVKGAAAVVELQKSEEKKQIKIQNIKEEILTKKTRTKKEYNLALLQEARRMIQFELSPPPPYFISATITSKGMVVGYAKPGDKSWKVKGMTISGYPRYDLFGMEKLINDCLDAIEKGKNGLSLGTKKIIS